MIERTDHYPTCTAVVGGDCECGPIPTEVWCEKGPEDAAFVVTAKSGDHSLCRDHALDLLWKMHAPAMSPVR